MRTEKQLKDKLAACNKVNGFGMSSGPCPLQPGGDRGCCAECSFPATVRWVLEDEDDPTRNGQDALADMIDTAEPASTDEESDLCP